MPNLVILGQIIRA